VAELKTAAPAAVAGKAHQAADAASELLRAGDRLDNPEIEKEASSQAAEAVNAIAQTSTADPATATVALQQISNAAANADNQHVARLANQSIIAIQRAEINRPPRAAVRATQR